MNIKFEKPRGQRVKAQFWWLKPVGEYNDYSWVEDLNRWLTIGEIIELDILHIPSCNVRCICSLKSALRHLKKHSEYLPKGMEFRLVSSFVGHDVYITI